MAAEVIDLDEWRRSGLSAAACLELELRSNEQRPALVRGWDELGWINQTDARDAIRIYARNGLHPIAIHGVVPSGACTCKLAECCDAKGKHPVYRGWQTAAFDFEALDRDLVEHSFWNVGLRMGVQPSGEMLVTIDVDGDRSLLASLEAELGPLPPTLTARTGSGGLHLIYRMPPGRRPPRNRVALAPKVDVRSEGGQIVVAPSRHVSGGRYRWLDARAPEVLP